ncbi:aminoglycoside phosphotransferase family protein [Mycetocola sp.]|uniref:aminoglycoside phosphotransferase family protein n=1 Tax=Mycetocola sp. TaxID=1871042 RepID=UPI003989FF94
MTMHDDEVPIDTALVSNLLCEQFPKLTHMPIREVRSTGTVNAVYRIGERLAARLPRVPRWSADLESELRWLPSLASQLSVRVPRPVHIGSPTVYYPLPWAVYEWIDGSPYADNLIADEDRTAQRLAAFVGELQRMDPSGAPPAGRRPLRELDQITRSAIAASGDVIDAAAALELWQRTRSAREWTGTPVWIHTDLLRPNLLVHRGELAAVIDWGGAGIGDPAADLTAAWSVFGRSGRRVYRNALAMNDDVWDRGRGYALHQAALIIPYYRNSNPAFVDTAVRTIQELMSDPDF